MGKYSDAQAGVRHIGQVGHDTPRPQGPPCPACQTRRHVGPDGEPMRCRFCGWSERLTLAPIEARPVDVSEHQVRHIDREGLDCGWPPL